MSQNPTLTLKFNNRECNLITLAAAEAQLSVVEYVRSIVNTELKDPTNPIHEIISEAVKSAGKKHLTWSVDGHRLQS